MSHYVIQRTDQGGGYLAFPGSHHAYTHRLQHARPFKNFEEAQAECCPENERVVYVIKGRDFGHDP